MNASRRPMAASTTAIGRATLVRRSSAIVLMRSTDETPSVMRNGTMVERPMM
jgi:hypothetical protein